MGGSISFDAARSLRHPGEALFKATRNQILCITDELSVRYQHQILSISGWDIITVSGLDAAVRALKEKPGVSVALVYLTPANCEAVEHLASRHDERLWVAIAESDDLKLDSIRRVIADQFFDYHTLPIDVHRLKVTLGHVRGMAELRLEGRRNAHNNESVHHDMIGMSDGMRTLYAKIDKVSPTDFPVLITGKSGTGKELVARAIHQASQRSEKPFVAVNCGAIVPTLIQSELFGHERGSFTSADKRRQGHFETANSGTIFLDEISELPLETQANLLRVLEDKLVRRIGGSDNISTDVRVIAATNCNISDAVARGKFREDLLYRLSVVHVEVPPLCDRHGDIEYLANYYLKMLTSGSKLRAKGFARNAVDAMLVHDWPGNVRELINRIKSAVLLCESRLIQAQDLGLEPPVRNLGGGEGEGLTLKEIKEKAEREAVEQTLKQVNFNVSLAARKLGVSRVTLYNLFKKHGIRE